MDCQFEHGDMSLSISKIELNKLTDEQINHFYTLMSDYDVIAEIIGIPSIAAQTLYYLSPSLLFTKYYNSVVNRIVSLYLIMDITNQEPVGLFSIVKYLGEVPIQLQGEELLELNLFIHSVYQNRGLATALITKYQEFIRYSYENTSLLFCVNASNTKAHRIATRFGAKYLHRLLEFEDYIFWKEQVDKDLFLLE
jgi:RimJ/RimL family protein N-acetyltransferase